MQMKSYLLLSLISLPTFKQISSSVSSARTINLKLTGPAVVVAVVDGGGGCGVVIVWRIIGGDAGVVCGVEVNTS